jgi:curved DNA-binding protein|tara:strand:- start:1622 stop:2467 length:846 start_codon:yes stop_codon:yes gene_type:complete
MKNYYDILGVSEDASNDQIKRAFKDIAKKEHPDRGGNEAKFKEANEAYDTLKDTRKRQEYDTIRKYGQAGQGGHFTYRSGDFFGEDIFENFFSGFEFGGPGVRTRTFRRGPQRNKSINVRMAISIKEAMNNNEKTINYKLPSGKEEFATVKIPAGVQHGVTFKFKGMGDDSIANVPRGDLLVQMTVLDSDGYTRKGNDLYTTKTISCFDAIRGCEVELKTLLNTIIKVKVPSGTQPGTLINCKGQGMPVHKTLNIRGNLYVKVMVLIPQLSKDDLKKIKNL